jgi:penicillin-binding protein 1A
MSRRRPRRSIAFWGADFSRGVPPIDRIVNYQPKMPLQVLTADGVELAQFGTEHRIYTPLSRTPKLLQDAVLAVEDTASANTAASTPRAWRARCWR